MREKASYNPSRHQRRLLRWAIFADGFFVVALVTNYYRFQWLGVALGNAPENFSFNLTIFIPLVFTSALISYFVAGQIIIRWKRLPKGLLKLLILMSAPIPILLLVDILQIFRA